ncbi:hypothetical protein WR25_07664 [Diploscapter pachys]|uniref:Uncharacterized protein n=1 Tax=Diploscapter pachys TaxID=2018661 RepID=A0A2A2LUZ1_9BILA|nr:hypothetical protein WR25_07664 [Diploscapter pachys]
MNWSKYGEVGRSERNRTAGGRRKGNGREGRKLRRRGRLLNERGELSVVCSFAPPSASAFMHYRHCIDFIRQSVQFPFVLSAVRQSANPSTTIFTALSSIKLRSFVHLSSVFLYLSTLLCNWLEWLSADQATNERIETNPRGEKQKEVRIERRGEGRETESETNRFTNGLLFRIISRCAL